MFHESKTLNTSSLPVEDPPTLFLKHHIHSSTVNLSLLWGGGFLVAFFTMNLSLIPALGGEYQPILFVMLLILALKESGKVHRDLFLPVLALTLTLMGISAWHVINQSFDLNSFIRCSVGLFFVLAAPELMKQIPIWALRGVIWIHFLFAILGLIYPAGAVGIVAALGLRGINYYDGWNAFFASEPSYAAINLVGVIALFRLKVGVKDQSKKNNWILVMGIFILILTKSITGLIFTTVLICSLANTIGITKKIGLVKLLLVSSIVLGVLSVLLLMIYSDGKAGSRINEFSGSIVEIFKNRSFMYFFLMEPSGAWRLLANMGGFLSAFYHPLGIGSLSLQNVIFEVAPENLIDFIRHSLQFASTDDFSAQIPLSNYGLFGGFLPLIGLALLSYLAIHRTAKCNINSGSRFLVISYIFIGLLWQCALTAPGWWFVLGYAITMGKASTALKSQIFVMKEMKDVK